MIFTHTDKDFLIIFIKNPLLGIRQLPNWSYSKLIIFNIVIAFLSAFIAGAVSLNFSLLFISLFLLPFISTLMSMIATLFFRYTFILFLNRDVNMRGLFSNIIFANIPFFIFQTLSGVHHAITLIGFIFSAILLIVGFVDNFKLPKIFIIRLISALVVIFILFWIAGRISSQVYLYVYFFEN